MRSAPSDGEQYRCILSNTVSGVTATTTSRTTTITVAASSPPAFTAQPASTSAVVGTTASFSVTVSGVPTPTLQWSESTDNITFTPLGGETASTYTTPLTVQGDVGVPRYYRCTASNASGNVDSAVATLTVTGAPTGVAYINFTSSSAGGSYAPYNVDAAWIQNGATFVATVGSWGGERNVSLVLWNSVKSGTDAVMGATQLSHSQVGNLRWNFDPAIPDGTYTLWLESADDNPGPIGAPDTASVTGANRFSIDFTITAGVVVETSGAGGGFSAIRISPFADPTVAAGADLVIAQDAGKVANCGSGGLFALLLGGLGLLGLRRRRA